MAPENQPRCWLMASRVSSATRRAAAAKSSPCRGVAYKMAREELIIMPVPLAVLPDETVAAMSPPCAPMPGTSSGMSPTIARTCASSYGQCALVVGATFPEELAQVRAIVGDMPLLVPGIGAQGGDIAATVSSGKTAKGTGMMINSSRAILYATPQQGEDFAAAARRVALETRDAINQHRG